MPPSPEVDGLKKLLAPGGTLYVFHQPPVASKNLVIEERCRALLEQHGYEVSDVLFADTPPIESMCVVARPAQ